ncbi:uncharacterized protein Z518_05546 [Rhinocladiella mackenziei CBS 650.93]|uniref:U3 small nucleolar ribonucleoprotein protein MPP10 n=1 Tax=Rhinocladiella mackenziei CBS 650.93 TaxID=1442369 RepID=A0A0D2ING4_9EURO|nr:uncharacterized protein Z518_05546 [Rhinocladiella mackenziei CBS 650.93]KIX04676.1 hypothetical protein Z518_05546 [Rhinocladiella mackenziei CBS 650.93]
MATVSGTPTDSAGLLASLSDSSQLFLQPSSFLHLETLACLKSLLDPLAADVADAQKLRRDENRRKRKRGDIADEEEVLQLRQIYTHGLGVKQVWEQARRVLDAACSEVEKDIVAHKALAEAGNSTSNRMNGRRTDDDDLSLGSEEDESMQEEDDIEVDMLDNEFSGGDDDHDEEEDIEGDIEAEDSESEIEQQDPGTYIPDPHHLNDGFFSIDDFNKQTQFLEQQDARGEDDNPSDEDEIDWDADPFTMAYHKPKGKVGDQNTGRGNDLDAEDDSGDDEDAGPTFGNADLNAHDGDEDMLNEEEDGNLDGGVPGLDNTNEIRYADFFVPPPKRLSKSKRMRALPKTQPTPQLRLQREEDIENDMQRAIADVRRDLLESDEEVSDFESGSDMDDAIPSMKNMSTHEKQRAAIAAEIRRLEAANVAKRDWTLSGEARAVDRPLNSLIEEDLEFERVGKPVPVITAEVSEEIERLVKRRILAREFDEVIRRLPDAIGSASMTRRGRIHLDDTKPQSGLADIYEQEHLRATDPGYVDTRSAATKKQHEEISRLWKEVSSQLDLLSNLHFKPKRLEVEIKAVEDTPVISMEDARPVGTGINGEASMLAPQEVYRPGEEKSRGDGDRDVIVRKSGSSVNKDEMTREEKLRRRRREKERMKKSQAQAGKNSSVSSSGAGDARANKQGKKSKDQEKADILSELRKGNVKVVGKKGELRDIDGKTGKKRNGESSIHASSGAGSWKL